LPAGALAREGTPSGPLTRIPAVKVAVEQRMLPSAELAIARWQLPPDSPWAPYSKFTLLSSLGTSSVEAELPVVERLESVEHAECGAAVLADGGLPTDTLWLVDLRGAASVTFASVLAMNSRTPVAPVLTFNNWPDPHELIPAEETLSALLTFAPRLPSPGVAAAPVFLLDAWRMAGVFSEVPSETFDNRYTLNPSDFPAPEALLSQGIRRVVYLVDDLQTVQNPEDDVKAVLDDYQGAGLGVAMADLAALYGPQTPDTPVGWELWMNTYGYRIAPPRQRVEALHECSPGGFGGTQTLGFCGEGAVHFAAAAHAAASSGHGGGG
jgi:hypothetical protein